MKMICWVHKYYQTMKWIWIKMIRWIHSYYQTMNLNLMKTTQLWPSSIQMKYKRVENRTEQFGKRIFKIKRCNPYTEYQNSRWLPTIEFKWLLLKSWKVNNLNFKYDSALGRDHLKSRFSNEKSFYIWESNSIKLRSTRKYPIGKQALLFVGLE